ncbi:unnamed protein product [Fraxinus pennsylvanica]|uniref:Uncharacterized protein n=1 Tax=Fraxinus pennsylvanica TaxID=56036 RepID=A0AAD1YTI0_9LAMI|nr:unnamed protein product [Fraxinus pennsylvanica]
MASPSSQSDIVILKTPATVKLTSPKSGSQLLKTPLSFIYVEAKGKNDFLIDDVLAMGSGGIQVGFDIGGGSGTFAARMTERNVTMVTATLNVDAPFNEFIAARGLFPLYLSLDHRRVYALNLVSPIPDELRNLTFLTDVNLAKNYLTGPLPPSIGDLIRMQYLSFGFNALSGELPKELGKLTDLRNL